MKEELTGKSLKETLDDETLPLCWKGERPFKSLDDVREYFKPIALSFANDEKDTQFELPPEAYLIISVKFHPNSLPLFFSLLSLFVSK